jgi:hypothetical protein
MINALADQPLGTPRSGAVDAVAHNDTYNSSVRPGGSTDSGFPGPASGTDSAPSTVECAPA